MICNPSLKLNNAGGQEINLDLSAGDLFFLNNRLRHYQIVDLTLQQFPKVFDGLIHKETAIII